MNQKELAALYWCKWWVELQGWTGCGICLEQSGRRLGDICYYICRHGIICMKRFMTLATPGVLGQHFWRHINKPAMWLVGFTKAHANCKNTNSTKSQCVQKYFKDSRWCPPLQIQVPKHLCHQHWSPMRLLRDNTYHTMISYKAKTPGSCKYVRCQILVHKSTPVKLKLVVPRDLCIFLYIWPKNFMPKFFVITKSKKVFSSQMCVKVG